MKKHYRFEDEKSCFYSTVLLTALTVFIWLVGCVVIGYVAWVMATSVSVTKFLSGNLIFTYAIIGLGFIMFFTGFLGCVGTTSHSTCLIKLYVLIAVLCIATQLGGVLTLIVLKLELADLLHHGWKEVNEATRSVFQNKFNCCGYEGPKEFAYRNDVIDASCYSVPTTVFSIKTIDNTTYWVTRNVTRNDTTAIQLKQEGCSQKLLRWVQHNKYIWIPTVAGIGILEILSVIVAAYIINHETREDHLQGDFAGHQDKILDLAT